MVGGKYGGLDTDEFLQMNPLGGIPVIENDGEIVYESHTILRYLAAEYSNGKLWHSSAFERAKVESWMDWSHVSLQPEFMALFWGFYRMPVEKHKPKAIAARLDKLHQKLTPLDAQLKKQSFVTGEMFSLADITCGSMLYRLCEMGLPVELPSNVEGWYQRLQLRVGYQKWIMSDFSELKARESY